MFHANFGRNDVLGQIRRARVMAQGTSVKAVSNALSNYADALERRWKLALIGAEKVDHGIRKHCAASGVLSTIQIREPESMYVAAKRDVVREMMRARRLAAGLSDPATVRALEEYAVELETQWRAQHGHAGMPARLFR